MRYLSVCSGICAASVAWHPMGWRPIAFSEVGAFPGADCGATSDMRPCVIHRRRVRRLTPREFERLQGFVDDYTRIAYSGKPEERCADGPRYQAIGNSMAVPVMRWLAERIDLVNSIA